MILLGADQEVEDFRKLDVRPESEVELAGLEPATSWVRSMRAEDGAVTDGMIGPLTGTSIDSSSPPLHCSTHHKLTTRRPHRPCTRV
jgi:hypothetical protein